jgi:p-aminobenzoyl-glutamate transporter AbgT
LAWPFDLIERLGNKLPEAPILFCWPAFVVVAGSAFGAAHLCAERVVRSRERKIGHNQSLR